VQALLTTKAGELARGCGFVRRRRKVCGSNFAQALVFTAMADPEAPESRLHATAALVGLNASRQAIDKRFNPRAAEFLRRLLAAAVTEAVAASVDIPLLRRLLLLGKNQRRGNPVSALSLALCDWTVLVTNVPRDLMSVAEALVLARMR
jgi:hypothetical protein